MRKRVPEFMELGSIGGLLFGLKDLRLGWISSCGWCSKGSCERSFVGVERAARSFKNWDVTSGDFMIVRFSGSEFYVCFVNCNGFVCTSV